MTEQLRQLGIPFETVRAVDAHQISDDVVDQFFQTSGPLGSIAKGDKCCTMSHRRAWETFLRSSDDKYGLILEDDVLLDRSAPQYLCSCSWIPRQIGLLKLEQFVEDGRRILTDTSSEVIGGRTIARLRSKHTGAAAYILSRGTAELLCGIAKWTLPVDHMLFNPNNSPLMAALRPYQLLPAIAQQSVEIGGATDIEEWRKPLRAPGMHALAREMRHFYYELRLLPSQILRVLCADARIIKFSALDKLEPPPSTKFERRASADAGAALGASAPAP